MHSFKAHTGCSVHQYIVQKRLTYAFDRIRDGQGIVETAHQAGFGDYSAFLKAFRKQYGCSPREVK
ncbi:MAG: helix-turn-helix transcriptional regulator, partial [Clostridia bacterium]|nr:helix-turn-helix transcriptional regulator [Clostridia bacterium]